MKALPVLLITFLAPLTAQAQVTVVAKPDVIYVENADTAQHLNFDFLMENQTNETLVLESVTLSVFDERDSLVRREFVNEYSRRSLDLVGPLRLAPRDTALIFNPFHTFASGISLTKLTYEFAFRTTERRRHRAHITVAPLVYETKTNLILPVQRRVLVWDGHDYQSHHRRFDYVRLSFPPGNKANFQRYGYDFVVVNERGLMHAGDSDDWYPGKNDRNEDYYGFGLPILAAGSGRVAAVHDGEPDNRRFNQVELATRETAYGGNYIVIDHLNGEFSWFGHLKHGSVRVKVGQEVKQGQIIAEMGASGDSLFPHLHYELRNGIGAMQVEGLPSYFTNFRRLLGAKPVPVKRGQVDTGDVVEHAGAQ